MKATTNSFYQLNQDATSNKSYNEQFLSTNQDTTTNESYNEQFLSIKSGRYNEKRFYNKCGGILLITESSIIFFIRERLSMLLIGESLFIVLTKERLFVLFQFPCTVDKS